MNWKTMTALSFAAIAAGAFAGPEIISPSIGVPPPPPPMMGRAMSVSSPTETPAENGLGEDFRVRLRESRKTERERQELKAMGQAFQNAKTPQAKKELEQRIRAMVARHCEMEIQKDREALSALEAQTEKTRARLNKRLQNKDRMIDLKTSELLSDPDLRW